MPAATFTTTAIAIATVVQTVYPNAATPTQSSTANSNPDSHQGDISVGAAAGIIVGVGLFAVILVTLGVYFTVGRKIKKLLSDSKGKGSATSTLTTASLLRPNVAEQPPPPQPQYRTDGIYGIHGIPQQQLQQLRADGIYGIPPQHRTDGIYGIGGPIMPSIAESLLPPPHKGLQGIGGGQIMPPSVVDNIPQQRMKGIVGAEGSNEPPPPRTKGIQGIGGPILPASVIISNLERQQQQKMVADASMSTRLMTSPVTTRPMTDMYSGFYAPTGETE